MKNVQQWLEQCEELRVLRDNESRDIESKRIILDAVKGAPGPDIADPRLSAKSMPAPSLFLSERRKMLNDLTSERAFLLTKVGVGNTLVPATLLYDSGAQTSVVLEDVVNDLLDRAGDNVVKREAISLHLAGFGGSAPFQNQAVVFLEIWVGDISLGPFPFVQISQAQIGTHSCQGNLGMNFIKQKKSSMMWIQSQLKLRVKKDNDDKTVCAKMMPSKTSRPVVARVSSPGVLKPKSTHKVKVTLEGDEHLIKKLDGKEVVPTPKVEGMDENVLQAPCVSMAAKAAAKVSFIFTLLYLGANPEAARSEV